MLCNLRRQDITNKCYTDQDCPAESDDSWHDGRCDDSVRHFAWTSTMFLDDVVTFGEQRQCPQEFR